MSAKKKAKPPKDGKKPRARSNQRGRAPARRRPSVPPTPPVSESNVLADAGQVFHRRAPWSHWMNVRSNLYWIYDGPVSPVGRYGKFREGVLSAWLLRRGTVTVEHNGQQISAVAGEWLVPWPGLRHQEFSKDASLLSVRFQAAWPDGELLFSKGLSMVFPARYHPDLESSATRLLEVVENHIPDSSVDLAAVALGMDEFLHAKAALLEFLAVFYRVMCAIGLQPARIGLRDERVIAALQHLDGLELSSRVKENDLALGAGLSGSQFTRLFREEIGSTPKQYFERRRLDYAEQMLAGTAVPIKEICYDLGFTRLSDFSAWCKNHFGTSPRSFRSLSPHLPRAQGLGIGFAPNKPTFRRDSPTN
jgi:AraC-like DNA-binding protein